MSTYFRVENMAVGVDINKMMITLMKCRKRRLKMNTPLAEPPMFLHRMSMGSLAKFIIRTESLTPFSCA